LAILAHVMWPRAQLLDGSILLKFLLEASLEFKSWAFDRFFSAVFPNRGATAP